MARSSTSAGAVEKVARYRRRARCAVIVAVATATAGPVVDPSPEAIVSAVTAWAAGAIIWLIADISKAVVDRADGQDRED